MWIQTQRGDEILEVKHVKVLLLKDGTANILAKLERETVLLGNYQEARLRDIIEDLKWEVTHCQHYVLEMPKI